MSARFLDQGIECRTYKVGPYDIVIHQQPAAAQAMREGALQAVLQAAGQGHQAETQTADDSLDHVGLVVWQSGFLLAEALLRQPPFGTWSDVRCVDLGTGTGVVAMALAKAGADVVAADLPAITGLTRHNVRSNCTMPYERCQVVEFEWGTDVSPLCYGGRRPDIITGADLLYQSRHFTALLRTLCQLAAAHTLVYLAYRTRGSKEQSFLGMLDEAGFAVELLPQDILEEESRDGGYCLLRAAKRE